MPEPEVLHADGRSVELPGPPVQCEVREGQLHLPDGPGLGVEIDEPALRSHRL